MNVGVIGAGYVGLTISAVFAKWGHDVYCVEKEYEKVKDLKAGRIPIYEPGLEELIKETQEKKKLIFTTDLAEAVKACHLLFIAVGTPEGPNGEPNLGFIEQLINELVPLITQPKIIVTKSTVPIGTNESIKNKLIHAGVQSQFITVVSNPEFLREGTAIHDMCHPDKIIIGTDQAEAVKQLKELYKEINAPYLITSVAGAEMIKYAANSFLAMKISFINEIARICDAYHVDVTEVAKGIGMDPRIGSSFLQAGLGYGGSCFPKDLKALEYAAKQKQIDPHLLQATQLINDEQVSLYGQKLKESFPNFPDISIAVWGAAFKPNTDDIRNSQAVKLINLLTRKGCRIHVYDPVASLSLQDVTVHSSMYESIKGRDGLVITTEWEMFHTVDWTLISHWMKGKVVLDCRNFIDPLLLREHGFEYVGVGRP